MQIIRKIPGLSLALLISGYAVLGWLLSIHGAAWKIWLTSGAIAFGINWIFAVGWAIAAIYFVFARAEVLVLSVGICLVWALLMYIARLEVQAISGNRWQAFFVLGIIAAIGMSIGWFADASLIPNIGRSLIKPKI
ncbi:hypothetical protein Syn7502_02694 [Synechococcus sp. PCC 7502]|uniref:hypothetical protein n=1 Tax=Synechococcus sp. PCC 7502 TaxID=1173263 RepID=UPI00029F9B11|nr:hypothetical protein [Synechococcus sp. PCC 7502]AFY74646.1 hypothetical protein Syn7502_02694 [Synechococcus sp. PCC 7502]